MKIKRHNAQWNIASDKFVKSEREKKHRNTRTLLHVHIEAIQLEIEAEFQMNFWYFERSQYIEGV